MQHPERKTFMFVPSLQPNSYVEILTPDVMVLEGGPLGRVLMNRVSVLIKEIPYRSLAPSTNWGHYEKTPSMNKDYGPHQNPALLAP